MKIIFLIIIAITFALAVPAQETPDEGNPQKVKREIKTVYKEWLNNDISFICTIDPRKSYLELQSDEEREKFIDEYWTKLENDPEYISKNERITRTVYADEHFTVSALGSKTDRGRIYILWGAPDKKVYGRMRIAGHEESVRFEVWTCEGDNFTFIDPGDTGDFRLIRDDGRVR